MTPQTESRAVVGAFRHTLQGIQAAEVVGAGCAWSGVVVLPAVVALLLWPAGGWGLVAAAVAVLGAVLLRRLAQVRWSRAAPLLDGYGVPHRPTWALPIRVPRAERLHDGMLRIWRVAGVLRPDGRRVTGEVAVERTMAAAWFVVWPAGRPRPREARDLELLLEPVIGGLAVATPDVDAMQACLDDPVVVDILLELVGPLDEVSVYPFAAWWRTRGPVDVRRLRGAEARLVQLGEALNGGSL